MKHLRTNEEAVSPVIGVILMVAITVVLAAVVYVLVSDLGGDPQATPFVQMQGNGDGDYTVLRADKGLEWEDMVVTGCTTVPTGPLDAGDVLLGCSDSANMVHRETNAVVWLAKP